MGEPFDNEAFYAALNAVRVSRQMTWKDVAGETGVNASTLTRMGQGSNPDVDGLAALLKWSNLRAEDFIPGAGQDEAEPLAKITALLRADKNLDPANAKLLETLVVTTYSQLLKPRSD